MRTKWFGRAVVGGCLLAMALLAQAKTTITFWAVAGNGPRDANMYSRLAEKFEARTGIHVEVTPLAWGSYETKYFAAMAAGLPPDCGVSNLGGPYKYGSVGGVLDLREAFGKEADELAAQFDPKMLRTFSDGKKLYGVPFDPSCFVVYIRTDVFKRLGLPYPKILSQFNDDIDKLEANNYRFFYCKLGAAWTLPQFTMPYHLFGMHKGPTGEATLDWGNPKYQEGVDEALSLWHMYNSPGDDQEDRVPAMFASDKPGERVGMFVNFHIDGSWLQLEYPEIADKWTALPFPRTDDGVPGCIMGGESFVVFSASKHKEEAFKWIQFLNTKESQEDIIVDRLARGGGNESATTISPVKGMYGAENAQFWKDLPELVRQRYIDNTCREQHVDPDRDAKAYAAIAADGKKYADLLKDDHGMQAAIAATIPNMNTTEPMPNQDDASLEESKVLDQMGEYIRGQMEKIAAQHNLPGGRLQLIHEFALGHLAEDRAKFRADCRAHLAEVYATKTPGALKGLHDAYVTYQTRYASILANIGAYRTAPTVMTSGWWVLGTLLVLGVGAVLFTKKARKVWPSYLFVGIPIFMAAVFVFFPAAVALYLSFTAYHPVMPLSTAQFIGLENYQTLVGESEFWDSIVRTLLYAVMTVPIGILLALIFAFLLNNKLKGERLWRFLYFAPLVTSVVSVSLIFVQLFLSGNQGWLNALLLATHAIINPIEFLKSSTFFPYCVVVVAIWQGLAFSILIFLAALQQVPESLYEAAEIDGASRRRKFWNIAVPSLRPQVFFVAVLGLIGAFQVFETIYMLAGKSGEAEAKFGPNDSGQTLVPLLYHKAFEVYQMGASSAIAYVLFFMLLLLTIFQWVFYRRREQLT